ncbi:hypothetical protein, partial [Aeromonas caviae]|uniref:hypothetical protein n=1 Tax=Aeromonas caviae TaxID=648 RepID=UPI001CC6DB94
FLERDDVQAILKRAERVTVAGENEKNPDAQAKADAGHGDALGPLQDRLHVVTLQEAAHVRPA